MYDLTAAEKKHLDVIDEVREEHGHLVQMDRFGMAKLDGSGQPVPAAYIALRGNKHAIDHHGTIWRFAARGSKKAPDAVGVGGVPWRSDHVEMWSGKWRKVTKNGEPTYAKRLVWVSLSPTVNAHPAITHIDWYMQTKAYKHPLDPPHAPSAKLVKAMEGRGVEEKHAVYARMEQELDKAVTDGRMDAEDAKSVKAETRKAAKKSAKRPKRSNQRAAR